MGYERTLDRIKSKAAKSSGASPSSPESSIAPGPGSERYQATKQSLQQELLESLDFEVVANTDRDDLRTQMADDLRKTIDRRSLPLNRDERHLIVEEILDNVLGLGPIEPLLRDTSISDILINGPNNVWIDRKGELVKTPIVFDSNRHLMQIIERIVVAVGRRVDEQNPVVDARLEDGSRFNAIIPPLSLDGASVSIRRFAADPITWEDLVRFNSCPRPMMDLLRGCVHAGLNTIVAGGGGSGKTTLLNVLSNFIPPGERIITIEDSAELQMQQTHVVRLETRPPNLEGKGAVSQRDLVKNCLRMRPDRIILGEVRGGEAIDMLTAMNTGHDGSLATVHANNPVDALARFETMVGVGMPNMTPLAIRETIARALDLVVQVRRLIDGTRRVVAITEVTGLEGSTLTTQDIFVFEQLSVEKDGSVKGRFRATGAKPRFLPRLASHGIQMSPTMYDFEMAV